jgi:hypothetical protein
LAVIHAGHTAVIDIDYRSAAMKTLVHLHLKSELTSAPAELHRYDENVMLNVLDLATRSVISVPAKNISCYLHTLFINGAAYQVMKVEKQIVQ